MNFTWDYLEISTIYVTAHRSSASDISNIGIYQSSSIDFDIYHIQYHTIGKPVTQLSFRVIRSTQYTQRRPLLSTVQPSIYPHLQRSIWVFWHHEHKTTTTVLSTPYFYDRVAQKYLRKEQRWSQCQCHETILPRFSCWRADTRPLVYSVLLSVSPLFIKTALRFSQAVLNVNMGNKKENSGVTASSSSSHNCTSWVCNEM